MTQNYASRTTLADVISALSHADLTDQQRRDQISAVRTIARALGAMPEEIPVDVQQLRARLDALSPGASGCQPGAGRMFDRFLVARFEPFGRCYRVAP